MTTLTEGKYQGDLIKHEDAGRMSREAITIKAGSGAARALVLGQVLGKRLFSGGAIAADEGNTGDGAAGSVVLGSDAKLGAYILKCIKAATKALGAGSIAADVGNTGNGAASAVVVGADAIVGDYILTCITAAADGGVFKVIDPNGARLDDLTVGVEYSNDHFTVTISDGDADFVEGDKFTVSIAQAAADDNSVFEVIDPDGVKLEDLTVGVAYSNDHFTVTIADGDTDFVLGDKFTMTVTAGDEKFVVLDLTAKDGTEVAAAVSIGAYSAADGTDGTGVAIVRNARLDPRFLVWPDGITSDQKTAAKAQLKALGILMADEG